MANYTGDDLPAVNPDGDFLRGGNSRFVKSGGREERPLLLKEAMRIRVTYGGSFHGAGTGRRRGIQEGETRVFLSNRMREREEI